MMTWILLLIVSPSPGTAGALNSQVACLRAMSQQITSETANRVGEGYVHFEEGAATAGHAAAGIYVLTAQALHFYSNQDLDQRGCGRRKKVDRFGPNAADNYDFYSRSTDRYRVFSIHLDQPDLRGLKIQIAVNRTSHRPERLLGWVKNQSLKGDYCKLSGHQVMDSSGLWRKKVDTILIAALENFYRRGSGVAKILNVPRLIQGPLDVCDKVRSDLARAKIEELRQKLKQFPETSTRPSPAPPAGAVR